MVKCIKIPLKEAQIVKKELIEKNVLEHNYFTKKDSKYIYFPVKKEHKETKYETSDEELKERKITIAIPFKDALKKILDEEELELAKTAYDHLGEIAIIEIPEQIRDKEIEIGKALLNSNPLVKTVLRKDDKHDGVFRTQKMKYLCGKETKIATYKENNCILKVNVEEVYFSARLATERKRICEMIKENEEVLIMFSGAAPYPCILAKNSLAKHIDGVEINPQGHKFGLENIKKNKVENKVNLYCGDVREVVPTLNKKYDRIAMPLPKTAEEFLDVAIPVAKKGATIHMYAFYHEDEFSKATDEIDKYCKKLGREYKLLEIVKSGQHAPRTYRICVDFKLLN